MSRCVRPRGVRSRGARAFTMLEATIALALLIIGLMGMGALSVATVRSNMDAHDRTEATNLAERVLEMIRTESLGWNNSPWSPDHETSPPQATFFPLMSVLPPGTTGGSGFGEFTRRLTGGILIFDANQQPVALGSPAAKFCAHYNLTWLQPNESARADVRVYWMRRGANPVPYGFYATCGNGAIVPLGKNTTDIRCVTSTTELMRSSLASSGTSATGDGG